MSFFAHGLHSSSRCSQFEAKHNIKKGLPINGWSLSSAFSRDLVNPVILAHWRYIQIIISMHDMAQGNVYMAEAAIFWWKFKCVAEQKYD